ncbi:ComEA family DNA-binding protein [Chitinophaga lutea]
MYAIKVSAQQEEHEEPWQLQEAASAENDEAFQERQSLMRRRLDLNTADIGELERTGLFPPPLARQLLDYRNALGPLLSIYELQAVPGLDLSLIRRMLPYVRAGDGIEGRPSWKAVMREGAHTFLVRYARGAEQPASYAGSRDKIMWRYRYRYPGRVSWGLVGEKDAGEQLFRGAQRWGFDHYGFHLFLERSGKLKAVALGDYTVNMGQGLIQWHGLSFGKSGAVMQFMRQGEVLRPYASAGEFYFYRGAGATLQLGRAQFTGFVSRRALDRSATGASLTASGYHRTIAEQSAKGNVVQYTGGSVLRWPLPRGHVALNLLAHRFSEPFVKGDKLYQLHYPEGSTFVQAGGDYAVGWRQLHCFGEAAADKNGGVAFLQGVIAALGKHADIGMLYRYESPGYRPWYANAFGERTTAGNESGLYMAAQLSWGKAWQFSAWCDVYRFPWIAYGAKAPEEGADGYCALRWQADKASVLSLAYRFESGAQEDTLAATGQYRWRLNADFTLSPDFSMRCRAETGPFAWMCHYQWRWSPGTWRITAGCTRFETTGKSAVFLTGQGFPGDNTLARFAGSGWAWTVQVQGRFARSFSWLCGWRRSAGEQGGGGIQAQLQWTR